MKLYSNYTNDELKKFLFGWGIILLLVYIPTFGFLDTVFLPYVEETRNFTKFIEQDGFLQRYLDDYWTTHPKTNEQKEYIVMFLIFINMGAILTPAFILMLFLIIIPSSLQFIFVKIGFIPKNKKFKISWKPFET